MSADQLSDKIQPNIMQKKTLHLKTVSKRLY